MSDVFTLQDEVTLQIVDALELKLTANEETRVAKRETDNVVAYDAFLQGWQHYQRTTPDDYGKAVTFFEKALNLDPTYSRAYAALAETYWSAAIRGWSGSIPYDLETCPRRPHSECVRAGAKAYLEQAMENPTALAYRVSASMLFMDRRYDEAVAQAERALALDESDPESQNRMAFALAMAGETSNAARSKLPGLLSQYAWHGVLRRG